ncbi:hypothetical protein Dimus_002964 [Dionaea muscipula]
MAPTTLTVQGPFPRSTVLNLPFFSLNDSNITSCSLYITNTIPPLSLLSISPQWNPPPQMAAESSREDFVYSAKLAEQAERYEEMVEYMEKMCAAVGSTDELTVEERNLLSVAYKNVIGARRASWRIISSIEQKEESRGNADHVAALRVYRGKIESELSSICDGVLKLLDSQLVPSASTADSKVFYLKMKGDYHRYLAEFKTGGERKEAAENTLNAYKSAQVFTRSDPHFHIFEFYLIRYSGVIYLRFLLMIHDQVSWIHITASSFLLDFDLI